MSHEQFNPHVMMRVRVALKHVLNGPWRLVDRVAAVQEAAASVCGVFQQDPVRPDALSVSVRIPVTDDDAIIAPQSETSTGSTQQLHQIVWAPTPQQLRFYIYNLKLGI